MVYGAGVSAIATRGYVQTPAVAGRTLKTIKVTTPSSGTISAKAALKIVDVDGAQIAPSKNTSTTKTTYEFTLGGTQAGAAYRIIADSDKNAQIAAIELIYE